MKGHAGNLSGFVSGLILRQRRKRVVAIIQIFHFMQRRHNPTVGKFANPFSIVLALATDVLISGQAVFTISASSLLRITDRNSRKHGHGMKTGTVFLVLHTQIVGSIERTGIGRQTIAREFHRRCGHIQACTETGSIGRDLFTVIVRISFGVVRSLRAASPG